MGISYSPGPSDDTTSTDAPLVMIGTREPEHDAENEAAYLDADTGDVWRSEG